jgi:hypothetical protein
MKFVRRQEDDLKKVAVFGQKKGALPILYKLINSPISEKHTMRSNFSCSFYVRKNNEKATFKRKTHLIRLSRDR